MTREEAIKMLTAKAECMTRDTSGMDEDCNSHNCDECHLCYEQGNMGEQIEYLQMAIKALEEPQWIPCCSERLPEEDLWTGIGRQYSNSVLITVFDKSDEKTMVDFGHTRDGEWYSETADEFIESIADWKVIAWMPLPEPWREGEQND